MSSYAADFTAHLAGALSHIAPSFVHPSPSSSSTNLAAQGTQSHEDAVDARERELRAVLAKLRPSSSSSSQSGAASTSSAPSTLSGRKSHSPARLKPSHLAHLVDSAFPPFQGQASAPLSPQIETVELVTLAQLTIATYGVVLRELMDEANELERHDEYWAAVESEAWNTAFYLVQSTPVRAFSLANVTLTRLRQLMSGTLRTTDSSPPSLLQLTTWRRALPPSLFLTSVFPHLAGGSSGLPSLEDFSRAELDAEPTSPSPSFATTSAKSLSLSRATKLGRKTARSLLFLTLSPLSLTRDEVATYRSRIREERDDLARRIGELTLRAQESEVGELFEEGRGKKGVKRELRKKPGLAQLFSVSRRGAKEGEVELGLEDVRQATWQTLIHLDSVLTPSISEPRMSSTPLPPAIPADLAHSLSYLLNRTLPAHSHAFGQTSLLLSPPGFWTRSWPYLLSIPLLSSLLARAVYNNRLTLRQYALDAASTIKGFLFDWVLEPVRKILDTLRGGSADEVALMGRESLRSDLDSLERMVVDFARDEWGLGGKETEELARKVRVGDLTEVLKVWEEDIKSPIKSTLRGSLIRTLLIQVQKVKVDVALATSGIEKMLKSQQLTFAFVGVAPSMLVLALVGRWVRGLVRRDKGSGKRRREEKKRCWLVVRQLDILLSSRTSPSSSDSSAAQTQGHLLLSLSRLRSHTLTPSFPSHDTQLLASFLADIRALEERGARAGEGERRELVGRVREWGRALRWEEGIRA